MRIVSASKYSRLRTTYERTAERLAETEKVAAQRLATITRQAQEITRLREQQPTAKPVPQPRPAAGDAELRRELELARRQVRELEQRVADLQASHVADTRELHDLRQGAES